MGGGFYTQETKNLATSGYEVNKWRSQQESNLQPPDS